MALQIIINIDKQQDNGLLPHGTKSSPEPMLTSYQVDPREHNWLKLWSKLKIFILKNYEQFSIPNIIKKSLSFCSGLDHVDVLAHWGQEMHIYITKLGHHWFG